METRTLLAIALSMLVLVAFQQLYVKPQQQKAKAGSSSTQQLEAAAKKSQPDNSKAAIQSPATKPAVKEKEVVSKPAVISPPPIQPGREPKDIVIESDLIKAVITERGGLLKHCYLKKYRVSIEKDSPLQDLVNVPPNMLPLAIKVAGSPIDVNSLLFVADQEKISLTPSEPTASLTLKARLQDGTIVAKKFTFTNNSYWVQAEITSSKDQLVPNGMILHNMPYTESSRYVFSGPSYYANNKLQEIKLKNAGEKHTYTGSLDWVAYGDNYFMMAMIPTVENSLWDLLIEKKNDKGLTSIDLSSKEDRNTFEMGLYLGPKEIDQLNAMGHNLSKAINFGWFDPVAKPLLYLLKFIYRYTGNYGVAIIIVTILIKIVFWPLAQKSAKSMKTMQKIQPKLKKLKEKYGDDKERMNRELMQLYKTYKVNPMSGCLPMLVQIPVFFALYKVLLQAIELRHAPFALWINDLSAPDRLMIPGVEIPYLGGIPVLTILMGASMYLQQKMSPTSMDPSQAKMMQFLPIVFTFLFINFPSGLVLYWLVNNLLSIAQQYYVNKFSD